MVPFTTLLLLTLPNTSLHYPTLPYTTLHFPSSALHCRILAYTATTLCYPTQHYSTQLYKAIHYPTRLYIDLHTHYETPYTLKLYYSTLHPTTPLYLPTLPMPCFYTSTRNAFSYAVNTYVEHFHFFSHFAACFPPIFL